jgi:hypothetical integral membrane protein (TIGR02206 family)
MILLKCNFEEIILFNIQEKGSFFMKMEMRYFLFGAIFFGWIAFYTKVFLDGQFQIRFHLPFELCNFMQVIILYAVVTKRMKVLDMIMYPAILGPIAALLYPFGIASLGVFYLCYFVFYHCTLIYVGVYRLVQRKAEVKKGDLLNSIIFMSVSAVFAFLANTVTGGNYMFISKAIFTPPGDFNYQMFLILFALICLSSFHFIIMICRGLTQNKKIQYKIKKRIQQVKA